ncbi:MAG: LPS export ABC transporter periplasmic protein LptC [Phycisphaerales bacterium]|nr:LPS export ABC transporter periplasmic protein LptC [Phycisphaerales bacterium]
MKRKLLLYMASLAVALIVFFWMISAWHISSFFITPGKPTHVAPVESGTGVQNLVVEVRNPQGMLEYVLEARQATPQGNGRYLIKKPQMRFFTAHGQMIRITSDTGDITVDQLGNSLTGQVYPRKGTLSGHAEMTLGPLNSFVPGQTRRLTGQTQMKLSAPIQFNYQQGLLTSSGAVHVRQDRASFDGSGLTVEVDSKTRMLDYVRIDRGDDLIIRDVGGNRLGAGSNPVATSTQSSATSTAPATAPSTAPNATPPLIYRLAFDDHVRAVLRHNHLQSHQMILYFQDINNASPSAAAAGTPAATSTAAPGTSTTKPATTQPASAAATTDNLVVHWRGPMIMRRVSDEEAQLASPKDVHFVALGRGGREVVLSDGAGRSASADELGYHTLTHVVTLKATALEPVQLADKSLGALNCRDVRFNLHSNRAWFAGPGSVRFVGKALAAKGRTRTQTAWQAAWNKTMTLLLAREPDLKAPGKTTLAIRHITLMGNAAVSGQGLNLQAQKLAAQLVFTRDPRQPEALSHLLAIGAVHVVSHNSANAGPDSIRANSLELKTTTTAASTVPQPSQLFCAGNVRARFVQQRQKSAPQHSAVYHITGQTLAAQLIAKAQQAGGAAAGPAGIGRFDVGHFAIGGGVHVDIANVGKPIEAVADTMTGNKSTGRVVLTGNSAPGSAAFASITQGQNVIDAGRITLLQKHQAIQVAGPGSFVFVPPASHAATAQGQTGHVVITWANAMNYAGDAQKARFAGNVHVALVGRQDQHSSLSCDALGVLFARRSSQTTATSKTALNSISSNSLELAQITASGSTAQPVVALDANYGPHGHLRTRLFLTTAQLTYNAIAGRLDIPQAGELSLEDYRPAAVQPTGQIANATATPMAGTRGQSAFAWKNSLIYRRRTGIVAFKGKVRMVYHPQEPIKLIPTHNNELPATAPQLTNPNKNLILLDCNSLHAMLSQIAGQTKPNAVELGMGGPMKLRSVQADDAALELSGVRLVARMLRFDADKEFAIAQGSSSEPAVVSGANGASEGQAEKITWDLARGRQGITLIHPQGNITGP